MAPNLRFSISELFKLSQTQLREITTAQSLKAFESLVQSQRSPCYSLTENDEGLIFTVKHHSIRDYSQTITGLPLEFLSSDTASLLIYDNGQIAKDPDCEHFYNFALVFLYFLLHHDNRIPVQKVSQIYANLIQTLFDSKNCQSRVSLEKIFLLSSNCPLDIDNSLEKTSLPQEYIYHTYFRRENAQLHRGSRGTHQDFKIISAIPNELDNLVYCFSDGIAVPLKDIPWHPYGYVVPTNLYPSHLTASGPKGKLYQRIQTLKHDTAMVKNISMDVKYLSHILSAYGEHFARKVPLFIAQKGDDWHKISAQKALPVLQLNQLEETIKEAQLLLPQSQEDSIKGRVSLQLTKDSELFEDPYEFDGVTYDAKSKTLHFLPVETLGKELQTTFEEFDIEDFSESSSLCKITFLNQPDPIPLLNFFKNKNIALNIDKLNESIVVASEAKFYFPSQEKNKIFVSISSRREDHDIENLHAHNLLFKVFKGLEEGLCGFWGVEARDIAARKRLIRANELKIYKHSGLVLLIISEVITHKKGKIEKASEYFKKDETFLEDLHKKIARYCYYLCTKEESLKISSLSDLKNRHISLILVEKINSFIRSIMSIQLSQPKIMYMGQIYKFDASEALYKILDFTIQSLLRQSGGSKAFSKSRFPGFSHTEHRQIHFRQKFLFRPANSIEYDHFFQLEFANSLSPSEIMPFGELIIAGRDVQRIQASEFEAQLAVKSFERESIDWFSLHPKYFFNGKEVSLDEAQKLLRGDIIDYEGQLYHISAREVPTVRWLEKFWSRIQSENSKTEILGNESIELEFGRSRILDLLALKRSGVPIKGDEKWQKIAANFDQLDQSDEKFREKISGHLESFPLPLRNFQEDGLIWLYRLYELGLGGILADDMGLGKTVQSIALFHLLHKENRLGLSLVVVPTSLVFNWKSEFARFAPNLTIEVFTSQDKDFFEKLTQKSSPGEPPTPKIIICTYGLMMEHNEKFKEHQWNIVFFDEAQNLKNRSTKRYSAAQDLKTQSRFALTGTPMENHYGEFFSVIDLVLPGALGNYKRFMKTYGQKMTQQIFDEESQSNLFFLKQKVRPLMIRRTKEQVLKELPEKTETIIPIDFDSAQKEIYRGIAIAWNEKIKTTIDTKGEASSQLEMLTALLRLRQICSCPQGVPKINYDRTPPKIELLISNAVELVKNKKSLVVFTNFLFTLDFIKQKLKDQNIDALSICGKDSAKQREKVLSLFNESSDGQVLVMTLKTGGVGLNLTKANYVFHLEPWWNPAVENQASDRVHRIGQKNHVQIYRYIMKSSVEENIQKLKQRKDQAFMALLGDSQNASEAKASFGSNRITQQDFESLLNIN